MNRKDQIAKETVDILRESSRGESRSESLIRIAMEQMSIALMDDKYNEVEMLRVQLLELQTARLDRYIMNAKKLHALNKEARDATS